MRLRRFIPNMSLLLAFDAVMRTGSVTVAAQDLGLTQSTVSRLIQTLESQLGVTLFLRHHRRLTPTDAAMRYSRDIAAALDLIQRGSMSMIANPDGGVLTLAVLPTFGTRWLAPRLPAFMSAHPGVSVNLTTRFQRFSFDAEPFDAVIFYGQPDWPGAEHLKLFDETVTACAAPEFLAAHPVATPSDLASHILLQLPSRQQAWMDWFAGQGVEPQPVNGMMMDQFSMMIQSAIAGLGVALLPDYLARIEIAEGRLCPILRPAVPSRGAYWLAWPRARGDMNALRALRGWIEQMTQADRTV
ncbi:MAG: LysR family transcriptional regulator [Paracoccus sp. (in: a-proteobacteria)]|nr:LysR family transcriptional regulator [Paracoccus sp. (in: a-proteobacteria)]